MHQLATQGIFDAKQDVRKHAPQNKNTNDNGVHVGGSAFLERFSAREWVWVGLQLGTVNSHTSNARLQT